MDTVVFDGVRYVKASVLAKKFRYTADYLGQLCRAKKVDARLIGRTWFVNPQSVETHKEKKKLRAVVEQSSTLEQSVPVEQTTIRKLVPPVIQNKTIKAHSSLLVNSSVSGARPQSVVYHLDDETLLPNLVRMKTGPPKTLRIEQVNTKKLRISNKQREASFHAGELPQASLSGRLEVRTLVESQPEVSEPEIKQVSVKNNQENIAISPERKVLSESHSSDRQKNNDAPNVVAMEKRSVPVREPVVPKTERIAKLPVPNLTKLPDSQSLFIPPVATKALVQEKVPAVILMSPLIATLIAVFCVLLIFSASTNVEVFDHGYQSQIILQIADLLEIFNR